MRHLSFCEIFVAVLTAATVAPVHAQMQDYGKVVPASAQSSRGLFDVHQVDGRLLFEIPDTVLGRDMVILSRLAKGQGSPAAAPAPTIVVRWERRGDRILLRAPSHENTADEGSAVALAVANWNFAPVLHALPISARGERTSVVDVTEMYLGDHPTFSLPGNRLAQFGVRHRDRDRTWLEWATSFPIHVEW